MKTLFSIFILSIFAFTGCNEKKGENMGRYHDEITTLIGKMTIEEKIGQMRQENSYYSSNPEALKKEIVEGKIGSLLNEVDVATNNKIQRIAVEESRLGIPLLIGRDVIHGFKTIFPIPLGLAATWNPEVVEQGARIAALEAASTGVNWTFAPMIDISRDARWGRIAESFGEDPLLVSDLGVAMVKGFQGEKLNEKGSILACAKHFVGYGAAEGGRDYNTTLIPERELRDVYLKPFKAATEAGVRTYMSAFNDLNGVPASGNQFLFREILKGDWNFQGMVVSDWASIVEMITHGFAADEKDAASKAALAGIDMEMATKAYEKNLKELVEEGKISEDIIDEAVYRILKVKFELGLFENPYVKEEDQYQFAKPEYLEAAKTAAMQSMVLLKNENNALPLKKAVNKVAVIGPLANQQYEQLGTWIFDGDTTLSVTPMKGLQEKLGENKVLFAEGLNYSRDKDHKGFAKAIKAAKQSDAIVLCVGEESILSGEAHCRSTIDLPGAQNELIKEISKTDKPVVLVVLAGRPLAIGEVAEHADAVIYAWHFGSMGGAALADLLMGDESPSGKLPVTFPKSAGQIPFYYNRKNCGRPVDPKVWIHMDEIPVKTPQTSLGNTSHCMDTGYEPLYPFGYGLSYTTFEYTDLAVESPVVKNGENIVATVKLKNSGKYAADEVVQLYVRDLVGDVTRPIKELKGYKRVRLQPGESKEIKFEIDTDDLSFYNQKMEEVTEAGEFHLWIGGNSESELRTSFTIQ